MRVSGSRSPTPRCDALESSSSAIRATVRRESAERARSWRTLCPEGSVPALCGRRSRGSFQCSFVRFLLRKFIGHLYSGLPRFRVLHHLRMTPVFDQCQHGPYNEESANERANDQNHRTEHTNVGNHTCVSGTNLNSFCAVTRLPTRDEDHNPRKHQDQRRDAIRVVHFYHLWSVEQHSYSTNDYEGDACETPRCVRANHHG